MNKVVNGFNVGQTMILGQKKRRSEIKYWCAKRLCTESLIKSRPIKCADNGKVSKALESKWDTSIWTNYTG